MTDEKKIKLHTTDESLLRAASTGEGAVELTPELMTEIGKHLDARTAHINSEYPKLVEACDYETRLAVTAQVFKAICDHARDGGTFRYLIYDRLGFEADAYMPLYLAGGMDISNEFELPGTDPGGPPEDQ